MNKFEQPGATLDEATIRAGLMRARIERSHAVRGFFAAISRRAVRGGWALISFSAAVRRPKSARRTDCTA